MFSRLLKTRLRQVSFVGGLALLVGLSGAFVALQPGHSAPDTSNSFITGSWMLDVIFPDGTSLTSGCNFNADLTASKPSGSMFCSGTQSAVLEGKGKQSALVHGSWETNVDGSFDWKAVRIVYSSEGEDTILAKREVDAVLNFAKDDGQRILEGSGKLLVVGPNGETQQEIPGINFRATPIQADSE